MKDIPKKARRIEAELRLKARALRRLKANSPRNAVFPKGTAHTVGVLARTPTPCSCPMCGNVRKHQKGADRETVAEQRQRLREKDE